MTGPALRSSAFAYAAQTAQGPRRGRATPRCRAPSRPRARDGGLVLLAACPGDTAAADGDYVESTFFTRAGAGEPWLLTYQLTTDPAVALPQPVLREAPPSCPATQCAPRGPRPGRGGGLREHRAGPPTLDTTDADQLATAHPGIPLTNLSPDAGTEDRTCALEAGSPDPAWVSAAEGSSRSSRSSAPRPSRSPGLDRPTPTTGTIGTVPAGRACRRGRSPRPSRCSSWSMTTARPGWSAHACVRSGRTSPRSPDRVAGYSSSQVARPRRVWGVKKETWLLVAT
ncbi:hypothetical protein NKG05_16650 [Oerskovia sp. M15]